MPDWLTHDGQASAASDGYVPLPSQVQQLARTMLQQVTGPSGAHLLGCAQERLRRPPLQTVPRMLNTSRFRR